MKTVKQPTSKELCDLAAACLQRRKFAKAEEYLAAVLEQDEGNHAALSLMAALSQAQGDGMAAFSFLMLAVKADPSDIACKENFLKACEGITFSAPNPQVKEVLLECLKTPGLDYLPAQVCWYSLFLCDSAYKPGPASLLDPFFLQGLLVLLVCNTDFEEVITRLRRELLEKRDPALTPLAAALAEYCARTEYAPFVTDEEKKAVAALGAAEMDVALRACYIQPRTAETEALEKERANIPAITPIDNGTSREVRAMYEESPYPRWGAFPKPSPGLAALKSKTGKFLVAGCGTGNETLQLCAALPGADVLAVDLSLTSLAYASLKAKEFNITNVRFRQADILALGGIGEKFDLIVCGGVLHHLEKPMEGWKTLRTLLAPGGLMYIALYSRAAHRHIVKAKEAIAKGGYPATPEGIRAFRRDSAKILDRETYLAITRKIDYYQLSMCRDMLFHVRDHRYDIGQIEQALKELGLSFAGFNLPGVESRSLAGWRDFEAENPDAFSGMYQFWCKSA